MNIHNHLINLNPRWNLTECRMFYHLALVNWQNNFFLSWIYNFSSFWNVLMLIYILPVISTIFETNRNLLSKIIRAIMFPTFGSKKKISRKQRKYSASQSPISMLGSPLQRQRYCEDTCPKRWQFILLMFIKFCLCNVWVCVCLLSKSCPDF